jgi:haloalkane dehalogenase
MFEPLIEKLTGRIPVIAPDTPGFGSSTPLGEPPTVAGLAAVLVEALHGIGVTECWLFGHHTGAALAVEIAARYPDLVRRLAVSGPPLLDDDLRTRIERSFRPIPPAADGQHLLAVWRRARRLGANAPTAVIERETIQALLADDIPAIYRAVVGHDLGARLAEVRCPTLVIGGQHDSLRSAAERAAELLQDSQSAILLGAGVYLCDERPDDLARLLVSFFLDHGDGGGTR